MPENYDLKTIAFNCSLKSANDLKRTSSTEKLVNQLLGEFKKRGAAGTIVRAVELSRHQKVGKFRRLPEQRDHA